MMTAGGSLQLPSGVGASLGGGALGGAAAVAAAAATAAALEKRHLQLASVSAGQPSTAAAAASAASAMVAATEAAAKAARASPFAAKIGIRAGSGLDHASAAAPTVSNASSAHGSFVVGSGFGSSGGYGSKMSIGGSMQLPQGGAGARDGSLGTPAFSPSSNISATPGPGFRVGTQPPGVAAALAAAGLGLNRAQPGVKPNIGGSLTLPPPQHRGGSMALPPPQSTSTVGTAAVRQRSTAERSMVSTGPSTPQTGGPSGRIIFGGQGANAAQAVQGTGSHGLLPASPMPASPMTHNPLLASQRAMPAAAGQQLWRPMR